MIVLRLVNIDKKYYFIREYETVGLAYKYLITLNHSRRIKCIGMFDTYNTPLPPHIVNAYNNQLPTIDEMIEYDKYPFYITLKGD